MTHDTRRLTTGFIVAMLAFGFISPVAAQPANAQSKIEANAEASANADIAAKLDSVTQRLNSIQQRLSNIQDRLESLEARANGQADASAEAGPAQANQGANVEHSVDVENGTKTISHKVEKNGRTLVSFVKEIFVGDRADAETQAELSVDVEGNVSQGNNVTVVVAHNGSAVANATVKVNGEVVGETDSQGQIVVQVENSDEFEVKAEKQDLEGELEIELNSEVPEDAEINSSTEAETSNSGAEAEADVSAETSLQ